MSSDYVNIRDIKWLGSFVGAKIVDITQHDEEEYKETGVSYVYLHFDNGGSLKFFIGEDGFEVDES